MRASYGFNEGWLEVDALFHQQIGKASGNDYLATIVDYISFRLKETSQATDAIYAKSDLMAVTIAEHQAILDAVVAQDASAARSAMAAHVRGAAQRLGVEFAQGPC